MCCKPEPPKLKFETALELLGEFFGVVAYSIAFVELAYPASSALRRFGKATQAPRYRKQVTALAQQLEKNSQWMQDKRQSADFSPKDLEKIQGWAAAEDFGEAPLARYLAQQKRARAAAAATLEGQQASGSTSGQWDAEALSSDDEPGSDDEGGSSSDDSSSGRESAKPKKRAKAEAPVDPDDTVDLQTILADKVAWKGHSMQLGAGGMDEDVVEDFVLSDEDA